MCARPMMKFQFGEVRVDGAARQVWRGSQLVHLPRKAFDLLLLLIGGLVVRLTVKDNIDRFAMFYYATPWPVLTAMAAVCLIHWWSRPRIRWVALGFFAAVPIVMSSATLA